jgi:hypothetical protein
MTEHDEAQIKRMFLSTNSINYFENAFINVVCIHDTWISNIVFFQVTDARFQRSSSNLQIPEVQRSLCMDTGETRRNSWGWGGEWRRQVLWLA